MPLNFQHVSSLLKKLQVLLTYLTICLNLIVNCVKTNLQRKEQYVPLHSTNW